MLTAIIQARMGSSRLPGKVLADVEGAPLLARVVERVRRASKIQQIAVATSTAAADDAIEAYCSGADVPVFRGSETDVLARYYGAALRFGATSVVRLTADCPLLDPSVIDAVIGLYRSSSCDYAANINPPSFPDGLDTEVFTFNALAEADRDARLPSEREHVTLYIRNRPERFRIANLEGRSDLSHLRWTVDEARDLTLIRRIYHHFGERAFGMQEICDLLARQPELTDLNAGIERDEGLRRSLAAEVETAAVPEGAVL